MILNVQKKDCVICVKKNIIYILNIILKIVFNQKKLDIAIIVKYYILILNQNI